MYIYRVKLKCLTRHVPNNSNHDILMKMYAFCKYCYSLLYGDIMIYYLFVNYLFVKNYKVINAMTVKIIQIWYLIKKGYGFQAHELQATFYGVPANN